MARYSLKPYQSTYVDPGSVKINEQLRQQFEGAFNADDALAGAVDEMDAASFVGDQALKKELEDATRQTLEERAARGDYETMGMDVAKSARRFAKDYAPLKQNYAAVQAYQAENKRKYDEGLIDAEQYQLAMAKSTHDYEGIQRNEDGSIDEGSFFSGYNLVNSVDFQANMSEAMKDYAVKEGAEEIRQVGQGPGGDYEIYTNNEWSIVPPEHVDMIFQNVISQPDAKAYLNQMSELRTFNLTDEDLRLKLMLDLDGDSEDPENSGLRGMLQEAIEEDKTEEAEALQKLIEQKEGLLEGVGVDSPEEAAELRRQHARQEVANSQLARERNVAIAKFAKENIKTSWQQTWDEKTLARYKAIQDKYRPNISERSTVTQMNNPGGDNVADIGTYISMQDEMASGTIEDFNGLTKDLGIEGEFTEEQILAGMIDEETGDVIVGGKKIPMTQSQLAGYKTSINDVRREQDIQQKLLEEAKLATGHKSSEQVLDSLKTTSYGKVEQTNSNLNLIKGQFLQGADIVNIIKSTLGMEGLSDDTAVQTVLSSLYSTEFTGDEKNAAKWEMLGKLEKAGLNMAILNSFAKDLKPKTAKIDAWLKKNSKRQVGTMISSNMPGLNTAEIVANTEMMRNHFIGKPISAKMNIYYNGQKQTGTGTINSLVEDLEWEGENIVVYDVFFRESPDIGEGGLALKIKSDKTGETTEIIIPTSEIGVESITRYMQSPSYKLALAKNRAKNTGLSSYDFPLSNGTNIHFDFTSSGADNVIITHLDGSKSSYRADDPAFIAIVEGALEKDLLNL